MRKKRRLTSIICASILGLSASFGCANIPKHPQSLEQMTLVSSVQQQDKGVDFVASRYKGKEIYTIEIDPSRFDVEVATARMTAGRPLAEIDAIMEGANAFAATNAGFFRTNGDHDSFVIENGRVVSRNDKDYFNSVFVVREVNGERQYSIVSDDDFSEEGVLFAIESISYIENHQFTFPCNLTRSTYCPERNKRSVIGITDDGDVHLIVARDLTIYQFGEYLAEHYRDAISLDGGGSVSLEYHHNGKDHSIEWEHRSLCKRRGIDGPCQRRVASAIVVRER